MIAPTSTLQIDSLPFSVRVSTNVLHPDFDATIHSTEPLFILPLFESGPSREAALEMAALYLRSLKA